MRRLLQSAPILLSLLALLACEGSDSEGVQVSVEIARSARERVTAPDVAAENLNELVRANRAFAFDLYQALRDEGGNLFCSPHSISLALAMTYAGARGETARQMADALHFTLPQDRLHPAFNQLDLELARRGEGALGKTEQGFQLNIVNALWGQTGYAFLPGFLDLLAENYGAGLFLLDFSAAPEPSRVTINDWVSERTENRVEELIPPGIINPLTRLVLTNAIYFNAAWQNPFDPRQTHDGPFNLLDGGQRTVPMMHQTASFGYAEGRGYRAVELPYDGRELSMVIVLPDAGRFESFDATLDAAQMDAIVDALTYTDVALTMPRFEIQADFSLERVLTAMGMVDAFSAAADLSGIDGTQELFIEEVLHQAYVSVDEAGTEAAAATAVVVQRKGAVLTPIEVTVDRPFVFAIRDIPSGALLFLGRVIDPGG